jgi:hypothetical protein
MAPGRRQEAARDTFLVMRFLKSSFYVSLAAVPLVAVSAIAACSSDSTPGTTPPADAATTDAAVDTGPVIVGSDEVKQKGRIVRANSDPPYPVDNAILTISGKTVNVNADGTYELAVP